MFCKRIHYSARPADLSESVDKNDWQDCGWVSDVCTGIVAVTVLLSCGIWACSQKMLALRVDCTVESGSLKRWRLGVARGEVEFEAARQVGANSWLLLQLPVPVEFNCRRMPAGVWEVRHWS